MTEPKPTELNDEEITKLIAEKIAAADDTDSGWFVGYAVMRMLPVMKELLKEIHQINLSISPDEAGANVTDALRGINFQIRKLMETD
jgi:hypothetical protein